MAQEAVWPTYYVFAVCFVNDTGLVMLSSCPAVFDEALSLLHHQGLTPVVYLIG